MGGFLTPGQPQDDLQQGPKGRPNSVRLSCQRGPAVNSNVEISVPQAKKMPARSRGKLEISAPQVKKNLIFHCQNATDLTGFWVV